MISVLENSYQQRIDIDSMGIMDGITVSDIEPDDELDDELDEEQGINWDDTPLKTVESNVEDTYDILAEAMNNVSLEERRAALHDIHGVSEISEETPELLNRKLIELEMALARIKKKPAYIKAEQQSLAYVQGRHFRLMFLRAEGFNARRAANRIVCHFEAKCKLFGEAFLGRDLKLSDLNEVDMASLRSGNFQWLSQRDRAGRAVFVWGPPLPLPAENRFRMAFWNVMNALRDEETQKRGVVGIVWALGDKSEMFDGKSLLKIPWLHRAVPLRVCLLYTSPSPRD